MNIFGNFPSGISNIQSEYSLNKILFNFTIRLVIEWRFVSRVKEQMSAFLDGFGTICPLAILKIFDENELELLMCGIQNIDVKDWKKNTLYKGDYYANHIIVQWFWRVRKDRILHARNSILIFVVFYRQYYPLIMRCARVCCSL